MHEDEKKLMITAIAREAARCMALRSVAVRRTKKIEAAREKTEGKDIGVDNNEKD